jgi:hypothetical protein
MDDERKRRLPLLEISNGRIETCAGDKSANGSCGRRDTMLQRADAASELAIRDTFERSLIGSGKKPGQSPHGGHVLHLGE